MSSGSGARRCCPDRLLNAEERSGGGGSRGRRDVGDDRLAPIAYRRPRSSRAAGSERLDLRRLEAARHAPRADGDALARRQVGHARAEQHAGMHEHLGAAGVRHDEAESSRRIEELDRRGQLQDGALCEAVERAAKGLIGTDLGGGAIKERVARRGQGRSGGFCVIAAFRRGERAFFVHGFAKSDRENLRPRELTALRSLADEMLGLGAASLEAMLANVTMREVECDDQAV